MVTEADREAELSKVIAELRALLTAATPSDLSTAARHTEKETVECPACQGDGEIEAADYCNFDGAALGVQFYGIGREFGAHEKLWTATIKALPMLLDAAVPARHRTASTAALTAEIQRLRERFTAFINTVERFSYKPTNVVHDAIIEARAALSTPSEVSEPVAEKVVSIPEWLAKDILHFCEANAAFPPRETLIPIGAINAFRERMERAVSEPVADQSDPK